MLPPCHQSKRMTIDMWPTKRERTGGRPRPRESELAKKAAEDNLQESLSDRHEVRALARIVNRELAKNHISQRITELLREVR